MEIGNLVLLQVLYCENNTLKKLPPDIIMLNKLDSLWVNKTVTICENEIDLSKKFYNISDLKILLEKVGLTRLYCNKKNAIKNANNNPINY